MDTARPDQEAAPQEAATQEASTQERILIATIELMEIDGIENLTTRSIATRAGVNIAAINYYFRSKDALVEAALALAWEHAKLDMDEFLSGDPWDPAAGIFTIMDFLMIGVIRFPNITQAHFMGYGKRPEAGSERKSPAIAEMNMLLERISARVSQALDLELSTAVRERTIRLFAAMFLPVFIPALFNDPPGLDFTLAENRTRYLHDAVDEYLRDLKR